VVFARGVLARRSSLPRVEFTSPQCLRLHAFAAASGDSTERSRGCGTSEEACGLFGLSLYVRYTVAAVSTNMRLGADWLGGGESQRLARRPSSAQIACRCLKRQPQYTAQSDALRCCGAPMCAHRLSRLSRSAVVLQSALTQRHKHIEHNQSISCGTASMRDESQQTAQLVPTRSSWRAV
jgi:hypothetical protein